MAQTKNITIDTEPGGTTSVMVEQSAGPADEGLNVGGVSLNTDLPWYGDAFIVLLSSIFAFSAASRRRCFAAESARRSIPLSDLKMSAR